MGWVEMNISCLGWWSDVGVVCVAAAGLYVYGDVADFKEGVDKAYAVLSSGKAITKVSLHIQKHGHLQAADWH
jgi:hypothetical protein